MKKHETISSEILFCGFGPIQRNAIVTECINLKVKSIGDLVRLKSVKKKKWLSYKGCGKRFLEKLGSIKLLGSE